MRLWALWKMTWISRSDVDHSCHTRRDPCVPLGAPSGSRKNILKDCHKLKYVGRGALSFGGVGRGRVLVANHLWPAQAIRPVRHVNRVMSMGCTRDLRTRFRFPTLTWNTGQDSRLASYLVQTQNDRSIYIT